MAALEDAASPAAEVSEEPLLYRTVVPRGAAALMPCSGVTVPLELTPALPPPAVCGLDEASAPITAIELSEEPRGRTLPLFFSSTVPSLASAAAWARSVAFVAVPDGDPAVGLSNSPKANISVSTWETMELRVAVPTEPLETAVLSALPK